MPPLLLSDLFDDRPTFNPLSPHDALKHFINAFYNDTFLETGLSIHSDFLYFLSHIKSSSSTTSRELRQQFAACSGLR